MLVTSTANGWNGVEVLTNNLAEGSGACAVEYAYAVGTNLNGIVDIKLNGVERFVAVHATNIYFLPEMQRCLSHEVLCCATNKSCPHCRLFLFGLLSGHKSVHFHRRLHLPEQHRSVLAVDREEAAYGGLTFEADERPTPNPSHEGGEASGLGSGSIAQPIPLPNGIGLGVGLFPFLPPPYLLHLPFYLLVLDAFLALNLLDAEVLELLADAACLFFLSL